MIKHNFYSIGSTQRSSFIYDCSKDDSIGYSFLILTDNPDHAFNAGYNYKIESKNCVQCGFLFFPPGFINTVLTVYRMGGANSVIHLFKEIYVRP